MVAAVFAGPEPDHGRDANSPHEIPSAGWLDIAFRLKERFGDDRVTLVAAGVAFYMFLAMSPAIAAVVSVYGLVASPEAIAEHLTMVAGFMPEAALEIVEGEVIRIAAQSAESLGLTLVAGVIFAIWSANRGMLALLQGLNIAFDERERRGILLRHAIALGLTSAGVVGVVLLFAAVGLVPLVLSYMPIGGTPEILVTAVIWAVVATFSTIALAIIYRVGPSRMNARWQWVSWGSAVTVALIVAVSILYSWYLTNVADLSQTYGSLSALIGLLLWLWLLNMLVLMGAELNAEIEHQTGVDSTVGADRPMGERGARMADRLGRTRSQINAGTR